MSSFVQWAGNILDKVDDHATRAHGVEEKHSESDDVRQNERYADAHVDTLKDEADGLKNAWMQTRADLEKARELLRSREARNQQILEERLEKQKNEYEAKLKHLKEALALSQSEFEVAASTKNEESATLLVKVQELSASLESVKKAKKSLEERIGRMADDRERLLEDQRLDALNHAKMIESLRKEYEAQQKLIDQENSFQVSTFEQIKSREISLEADNVQYASALGGLQRELEQQRLLAKRVETEKKWLEADKQVLSDEVSSLKNSALSEKQEHENAIALVKSKLDQALIQMESLRNGMDNLQNDKKSSEHEVQQLRADLEHLRRVSVPNDELGRMQKDIEYLTHQVLEKQSSIENLIAERNSLRFKFENEVRRAKALEDRIQKILDVEQGDALKGRLRSRGPSRPFKAFPSSNIQSKALSKAFRLLDFLGTEMVEMMKHHPFLRMSLIVYIFVLHLWVLFVFYHFVHHKEEA